MELLDVYKRQVVSPDFTLFPKYGYGMYRRGDSSLIVSAGMGEHTIPVRICNPRELVDVYKRQMQFGGDDQWSNMLGGTELIRRKLGKDAYAMTINLLLNSEGKKMGKTQSGAVWLDPNKTTPFDFYQYWSCLLYTSRCV